MRACVRACVSACVCVCLHICSFAMVRAYVQGAICRCRLPSNSVVLLVNQLRDVNYIYTYDGCIGVTCEGLCMNGTQKVTCAVSLMLPGVCMHASYLASSSIVSFSSLYICLTD